MDIDVERLMEFYFDTLDRCGIYLLNCSEEDIEYNIFEEFDIGATSFLHEESLIKLKQAGFITHEIYDKSLSLRKKLIKLRDTDLWNAISVKSDGEWRSILELSDNIKLLLKAAPH